MTDQAQQAPAQEVSPRRVAVAAFVGTAIEWYDYFLFGTAAALVFNVLFFTQEDAFAASIASFATFAVGFFARPVGAAVFGHFGDRIGRKSMLYSTLLIMGVATTLVGLLPTYASAGIWAPIMLVILRIAQGFAVGGEWGGAVALSVEHADANKRGLFGSFVILGSPAGTLLATGAFTLVTLLPEEQFLSWGWRIPFLFSIVLVGVGLYIRMSIVDAQIFAETKEKAPERPPIVEVMRNYPRQVLVGVLLRLGENVSYYAVVVYAVSYAKTELGMSSTSMLVAVMLSATTSLFLIPFFGSLSDRVGRRPVYLCGALGTIVTTIVFFLLLETRNIFIIIAAIIAVAITRESQASTQAALFTELFPTRVRVTGISLAAQIGGAIGGGLAPLIAAVLLRVGGIGLVIGYVVLACLISAAALFFVPSEGHRRSLEQV